METCSRCPCWRGGLQSACAFLSKSEVDSNEQILNTIKEILQRDVFRIDYDLPVHSRSGFFESLARKIGVGIRDHDVPSLIAMSDELRDLYRKLFYGKQGIRVNGLESGFGSEDRTYEDGSLVYTLVHSEDDHRGAHSFVVRVGARPVIKSVKTHWEKLFKEDPVEHGAHLTGFAETLHYAAMVISVAGLIEDYRCFSIVFERPLKEIVEIVDRIFALVCGGWYKHDNLNNQDAKNSQPKPLDSLYRRDLGI